MPESTEGFGSRKGEERGARYRDPRDLNSSKSCRLGPAWSLPDA